MTGRHTGTTQPPADVPAEPVALIEGAVARLVLVC